MQVFLYLVFLKDVSRPVYKQITNYLFALIRIINCTYKIKAYTTGLITLFRKVQMLVLTRRENESLIIGENIKLTILAVKGGQVRVGIEAPNEVPIHREELLIDTNEIEEVIVKDRHAVNGVLAN